MVKYFNMTKKDHTVLKLSCQNIKNIQAGKNSRRKTRNKSLVWVFAWYMSQHEEDPSFLSHLNKIEEFLYKGFPLPQSKITDFFEAS